MSTERRSSRAQLSEVTLHYLEAGDRSSPPLVLLHGWPQTSLEWSAVMPRLAQDFWVIAPDLRGLGASSKPLTGYDTRTVAGDIIELADELEIAAFRLVGHDIGGMVGYALAATHRDRVESFAFLDALLPGISLDPGVDVGAQGKHLWHINFHASPMGEYLVRGRERDYLTFWFREYAWDPEGIPADHVDAYVTAYSQPGALRSGFAHYAAFSEDVERNRESAKEPLTIPVLAMGGVFMKEITHESMRRAASDVRYVTVERAGHWLAEEQPEFVAERLVTFFTTGE